MDPWTNKPPYSTLMDHIMDHLICLLHVIEYCWSWLILITHNVEYIDHDMHYDDGSPLY